MTLASFFILFGVGGLFWTGLYYRYYIKGGFSRYPEPVAKKLRKALYYSNIRQSPPDAVKFYWEALETAGQVGLDPMSDEMLGIKIQLAAFLEQIEQYQKAIDVLEHVWRECRNWIDQLDEPQQKTSDMSEDRRDALRTRPRLLAKAVSIAIKLGELYSHELVDDKKAVEVRLTWAVETVLKEERTRGQQQPSHGLLTGRAAEGDLGDESQQDGWLSPEQVGATFEALAHHYEARQQYDLAVPLFLRALSTIPEPISHSITLMNNIASCFSHQSQKADAPHNRRREHGGNEPSSASRDDLIRSSRAWASKAYEMCRILEQRPENVLNNDNSNNSNKHAQSDTNSNTMPITAKPHDRVSDDSPAEECAVACVAVRCNLAKMARDEGALEQAGRLLREAAAVTARARFRELYPDARGHAMKELRDLEEHIASRKPPRASE